MNKTTKVTATAFAAAATTATSAITRTATTTTTTTATAPAITRTATTTTTVTTMTNCHILFLPPWAITLWNGIAHGSALCRRPNGALSAAMEGWMTSPAHCLSPPPPRPPFPWGRLHSTPPPPSFVLTSCDWLSFIAHLFYPDRPPPPSHTHTVE